MNKQEIIHEIFLQADASKRSPFDVALDHLVQCKLIIVGQQDAGAYADSKLALRQSKIGGFVDPSEVSGRGVRNVR